MRRTLSDNSCTVWLFVSCTCWLSPAIAYGHCPRPQNCTSLLVAWIHHDGNRIDQGRWCKLVAWCRHVTRVFCFVVQRGTTPFTVTLCLATLSWLATNQRNASSVCVYLKSFPKMHDFFHNNLKFSQKCMIYSIQISYFSQKWKIKNNLRLISGSKS